ncbi:MAG: hypothetical protein C0606_17350 [Hyphomicrobiales bacterium]|nr:MAG: hypothetical protein C0606_17350 [Hyphomicrobiales bacterium]
MAETSRVQSALQRFEKALNALEEAVELRLEMDQRFSGIDDELQRLSEDRSRLAQDLDTEQARSTRLEETNREVSRRLVSAMESVRSVLEAHDG